MKLAGVTVFIAFLQIASSYSLYEGFEGLDDALQLPYNPQASSYNPVQLPPQALRYPMPNGPSATQSLTYGEYPGDAIANVLQRIRGRVNRFLQNVIGLLGSLRAKPGDEPATRSLFDPDNLSRIQELFTDASSLGGDAVDMFHVCGAHAGHFYRMLTDPRTYSLENLASGALTKVANYFTGAQ